jgi:hypothetical protein
MPAAALLSKQAQHHSMPAAVLVVLFAARMAWYW